ncbi:MAG: DUF427 domain-containing protein [Rhodospirillales bacterium]|nr:DUF427 domain-containing protein [Acetobacter sp.]
MRASSESVWEYPRPPKLEPTAAHVRIEHRGIVLAETRAALRVLETSHPPVFYLPQQDLRMDLLKRSQRRGTFCEFKGAAVYWTLDLRPELGFEVTDAVVENVAWSYAQPTAAYRALQDHLAVYASRVDRCSVDGETVVAQAGDFYGGWITSAIRGPFKGAPGTLGW